MLGRLLGRDKREPPAQEREPSNQRTVMFEDLVYNLEDGLQLLEASQKETCWAAIEPLWPETKRQLQIGNVGGAAGIILVVMEGDLGLLGDQQQFVAEVLQFLTKLMLPACREQAYRCVRRLLQLGVPFEVPDIYDPIIHQAASVGDRELLHAVLKAGENKDRMNKEGFTPLHLAILEHDVPMTEDIIAAGADVSLRVQTNLLEAASHKINGERLDDNWAALDFAAVEGRVDLVRILVANGAAVNELSDEFRTALHAAAVGNQVRGIDTLMELGADVEGGRENSYWIKPVEVAAEVGAVEAVMALVRHGTDLNDCGVNPLVYAVKKGWDLEVVRALLAAGSDPSNGGTGDGSTPLHTAAAEWPREDVARVLLHRGANALATDDDGHTPLHVLASRDLSLPFYYNSLDCMSPYGRAVAASSGCWKTGVHFFVLEAGIAVDSQDSIGLTPLHLACSRGNIEAITALLSHGADINVRDGAGRSPLHHAALKGFVETVDVLLGLGADANCADKRLITPLHLACSYSHRDACAALVKHCPVNIDAQDQAGHSPLHFAVDPRGFVSRVHRGAMAAATVDLLLRADADETIANKKGHIPLVAIATRTLKIDKNMLAAARLLARARADKAWRRRCLLLLCRAFPEKARLEPIETGAKLARLAESDGAAAADVGDMDRSHAQGDSNGGGDFSALMARLFELQEEGIFRAVISCL